MINLETVPPPQPKIESRWIIKLTMPSGATYAASEHDGEFLMSPISNGIVSNALCWDSEEMVRKVMDKFCENPKSRKFFDELKAAPMRILVPVEPFLQ